MYKEKFKQKKFVQTLRLLFQHNAINLLLFIHSNAIYTKPFV